MAESPGKEEQNNAPDTPPDITTPSEKLSAEKALRKTDFEDKVKDLEKRSEDFLATLNTKAEEFKQTVKDVNTSFEGFAQKAEFFSSLVSSETRNILGWFLGSVENLIRTLRYVLVGASAVFGVAYLALYQLELRPELAIWPIVAVASIVLLQILDRRMRNKLADSEPDLAKHMTAITKSAAELGGRQIDKSFDTRALVNAGKILNNVGKEAAFSASHYIPYLEKFFDVKSIRYNQAIFANNFYKSVRAYGVTDNNGSLAKWAHNFLTPSREDKEWLEEACNQVSKFMKVDALILEQAYLDYTEETDARLADHWKKIKDKGLIADLVKLVLSSEKITEFADVKSGDDLQAIVQMVSTLELFKLSDFKDTYYSFYVELARKKVHIKNALAQIGFNVEELESSIYGFVPKNYDSNKWEAELIQHCSSLVGMNSLGLSLFYFERTGQYKKRKQAWEEMLDDDAAFADFLQVLLSRKTLEIGDDYKINKELVDKIRQIVGSQTEFEFIKIKYSIFSVFQEIDNAKDAVIQTLQDHDLQIKQNVLKEIQSFIPKSNENFKEICRFLGKRLDIDADFILLLYGNRFNSEIRNEAFANIKAKKSEGSLASFLIDKGKIKIIQQSNKDNEVNNVALIIRSSPEFNLLEVQNKYTNYSNLLEICGKLVQFLKEEGLQSTLLDFQEIMKTVPDPQSQSRLDNILALCTRLLRESGILKEHLDKVAIAIVCIFLVRQEDISSRSSCFRAQPIDLTSQILYHNMRLKEIGSQKREQYLLVTAIDEVISGVAKDFQYLADFRRGLAGGVLFATTNEMLSKVMDDVQEQIKQLGVDKQELEESVKTVMNIELSSEFLTYAIQSNLVQAYLISSKSQGSNLKEIIDTRMRAMCDERLSTEPELKDFLLMDPSISVGKYTRVGVVPFSMDFDDFSRKFHALFEEAVDKYIEEQNASGGTAYKKSDFSVNIFRIMVSPTTFKTVRLGESEMVEDPVKMVGRIIEDRFSVEDKFVLHSTSKSAEERIVLLKGVVNQMLNMQGSFYRMITKWIGVTVEDKEKLEQLMLSKTFDKKFLKLTGSENKNALAISTYNAIHQDPTARERIRSLFTAHIKKIAELDVNEQDSIVAANALVEVLYRVGNFLSKG
ncbi:MAG: hypothetical protein HRF40_14495 [Nitrososphaera sp.]|jgi:hypothetical protein